MALKVNLFSPHKGQQQVIEGFSDSIHKFGIVTTGRQLGKSLLAQNLMLYWLLTNNNSKGAWMSPVYGQARKVFKELTAAAHGVIESCNKAELTINFVNGSTLIFLSTERPSSIRGYSFSHVILDEAAFITEAALTEAILPTMTAIGKKCLIISTPKGKNWFYNYYIKGSVENDQYISFTATSYDNPYVDKSFIDEQRSSLPTDIFNQEYMAKFTDAGSEVFRNLDAVCLLNNYERTNERSFFGVDVGLSNDYSTLCIITESGRVQHMDRVNGENITTIANKFISTLRNYNISGGYIESNGIGQAMVDLIKPKQRKAKAFFTTQDNKTQIVRTLIEDIETQSVMLPSKELNSELYKELSLYTYKISANGKLSFSHPNGQKDDLVDCLLLANKARNEIQSKGIHIGVQQKVSTSWGKI